jgi:hypothetical protein
VLKCTNLRLEHHIARLYEEAANRLPVVKSKELRVWNDSLLFLLLKSAQFHPSRGGTRAPGFSSHVMQIGSATATIGGGEDH